MRVNRKIEKEDRRLSSTQALSHVDQTESSSMLAAIKALRKVEEIEIG